MSDGDWKWLASTRDLQETAFGMDFSTLSGDKLADYVTMNVLAATDELHEALAEIQWKPWAKNRGDIIRESYVDEIIDTVHFVANLLTAVGVSDEEWQERYQAKQARNRARQAAAGGYDARRSKCPRCRRELDKPGATRWDSHWQMLICASCLDYMVASVSERDAKLVWRDEVDGSLVWVAPRSPCRNPGCARDLNEPGSTTWSSFDNALRCATCLTIHATMSPSNEITWYDGINGNLVWGEPYEYITPA